MERARPVHWRLMTAPLARLRAWQARFDVGEGRRPLSLEGLDSLPTWGIVFVAGLLLGVSSALLSIGECVDTGYP